jgi:hypothetical protein
LARVTLTPIKKDPFWSMHVGRTKVELMIQRQKHGGKDAGAILARHGVKTFAGYYDDHKRGEIITAERTKVFMAFGAGFARVDTGDTAFLIKRAKDTPIFFVHNGGREIARGKIASNSCFLDTHDAGLVKLAPEILILLALHDLPAAAL